MVSRQETARPLLTPGEVMQLPPTDELVLVSGVRPIRASKARFYEDGQLQARVIAPPPAAARSKATSASAVSPPNGWTKVVAVPVPVGPRATPAAETTEVEEDPANAGIRREPELPEQEDVAPEPYARRGSSTSTRRTARKTMRL